MTNNHLNLDILTKEDTASVAIALLYTLHNLPEYSIVSELPYLVDYDGFIKLIKYYSGMTIRIPTIEEVSNTIKLLLLYQNFKVKGMEWQDALHASGFSKEDSRSVQAKLVNLEKLIKSQEIGGRDYV